LPRWVHLPTVHFYIYVVPWLCAITLAALWAVVRVKTNALTASADTLLGTLSAGAASWTGGIPLQQLLAIAPLGDRADAQAQVVMSAIRHGFTAYAACLILYYVVAFPCTILQIALLTRQVHLLRQTAKHESRISKEELKSTASRHRRTISHVERKAKSLIAMCWARVASAIGITLASGFFGWLAGQFRARLFPFRTLRPRPSLARRLARHPDLGCCTRRHGDHCPLVRLGSALACILAHLLASIGYTVLVVPIHIVFFIRSFDDDARTTAAATSFSNSVGPDASQHAPKAGGGMLSFGVLSKREAAEPAPLQVHVDIASAVRVDIEDEEEKALKEGRARRFA
jgi:hypothetical protein